MGRLLRGLAAVQEWTAAAGLVLISALVVVAVVARYVLQAPLAWSEEGSKLTLMLVVYFGTGAISFHGDHLRADIFGESLSPSVLRLREIIVEGLMAALFALIAYHAAMFASRIREVGQITAALAIPQWLLIALFAVGMGAMVLSHVYRLAALVRDQPLPRKSAIAEQAEETPL